MGSSAAPATPDGGDPRQPGGRAGDVGEPDPTAGSDGSGEGERCEVHVVHDEAVRAAREALSDDGELAHLSETFQVLANPTRLRIVEALAGRELCVCDLAAVVESSQSSVSHHLRQLREMNVVRYRKEGRMAFYRLDDEHIDRIFRTGLEHVRE